MVTALLLGGCAPVGEMIQNAGKPTAEVASSTERSIDEVQLEAYNGPKARVAVYRFEDQTAKGGGTVQGFYWYTPQIGNGMAEMLNDALLQSNRFIVLDRQGLKDVLQEQDLAAAGRISRATATPTGEIEGAELLVKGAITEFEPGATGASAAAGLGAFGLPGAVIGGVLGGVRQSHVAMVVQVVDAKTTRILFSTTVEGKANDFSLGGALIGFGGGFGGGAGLGQWQKTPVEKAIRIAILKAVKEISAKTPQTYYRHGSQAVAVPVTPAASAPAPIPAVSIQPAAPASVKVPTAQLAPGLPSSVVVKVRAANLRDGPSTQAKVVTTVKEGTKLTVQAEDQGWYFVQTDEGKAAWIFKPLTQ
jgi:curli biogenesis system outer membrane secretion channel CsgG